MPSPVIPPDHRRHDRHSLFRRGRNPQSRPVRSLFAFAQAALLAGGCAPQPDDIRAQSVPHHQFRKLECAEIIREIQRVETRGEDIYKVLHEKASTDATQMAIGLIIFWPTLLLLEGGDGVEAAEYGRLQGEHRELITESARKNCDISSLPTKPFYERMEEWRKEQQKQRTQ